MSIKVLFIRGLPDDNTIHGVMYNGELRHLVLGCANVRHALRDRFNTAELLFVGKGEQVPVRYQEFPHVIFNEISDPDTHGLSLLRAKAFCDDMPHIPKINDPGCVQQTTRDALANNRGDVPGLTVPKTARVGLNNPKDVAREAKKLKLAYPLLVRVAGLHGGKTLVKVESADEIDPLHALPLDGRDFYLTEYHDFRSDDGLYRKHRLAVVGGKAFPRHLLHDDQWLVNASGPDFAADKPDLQDEKKNFVETFSDAIAPKISEAVRAMHESTGLDYFGVDCHINDDGEVLLFEVNANMNLLVTTRPQPEFSTPPVERIQDALSELIAAQLKS